MVMRPRSRHTGRLFSRCSSDRSAALELLLRQLLVDPVEHPSHDLAIDVLTSRLVPWPRLDAVRIGMRTTHALAVAPAHEFLLAVKSRPQRPRGSNPTLPRGKRRAEAHVVRGGHGTQVTARIVPSCSLERPAHTCRA